MPFLDFLEGLSPWWWVALAFALGALELATGTYVLIWISLAALAMSGIMWTLPEMGGEAQVVLFAVLSVALTFAGRGLLQRFGDGADEHATLNQRGAHLVGRTATVLSCDGGAGSVEIDGMRWRARWVSGEVGNADAKVRVTAANGMELTVSNV